MSDFQANATRPLSQGMGYFCFAFDDLIGGEQVTNWLLPVCRDGLFGYVTNRPQQLRLLLLAASNESHPRKLNVPLSSSEFSDTAASGTAGH
jgi:hypothetical protein